MMDPNECELFINRLYLYSLLIDKLFTNHLSRTILVGIISFDMFDMLETVTVFTYIHTT